VSLSTAESLDAISRHSEGLAAAARDNLAAPVEHCPDWKVADLVRHMTEVHWFWRTVAADLPSEPPDEDRCPPRAADEDLVDAFLAARPSWSTPCVRRTRRQPAGRGPPRRTSPSSPVTRCRRPPYTTGTGLTRLANRLAPTSSPRTWPPTPWMSSCSSPSPSRRTRPRTVLPLAAPSGSGRRGRSGTSRTARPRAAPAFPRPLLHRLTRDVIRIVAWRPPFV
jgi:hypothetical protein